MKLIELFRFISDNNCSDSEINRLLSSLGVSSTDSNADIQKRLLKELNITDNKQPCETMVVS